MNLSRRRRYRSRRAYRHLILYLESRHRRRNPVNPLLLPPSGTMPSEKHWECSGWPLAMGKVRGLRSFTINLDGSLGPASYLRSGYVWQPGENVVYCDNDYSGVPYIIDDDGRIFGYCSRGWYDAVRNVRRDQICEDGAHSCGLWAYYDRTPYMNRPWATSGIIDGYGRTEIGSKGFRASKAELVAIVCRDRIIMTVIFLCLAWWGVAAYTGSPTLLLMGSIPGTILACLTAANLRSEEKMSTVGGVSLRRLRRMRRIYSVPGGPRIYSTRWLMLRRHPVDMEREEIPEQVRRRRAAEHW